jgi:hypothetical protein
MTAWHVDWTAETKGQLASAWLIAPNRKAVTVAADHIDQLLAADPRDPGQEVAEGLWKLIVPPLVAYYEIDDASRTVKVTGVVSIV